MKKENRRQLFTHTLRASALTVLTGAGGWAWMKRRRLLREGSCLNQGVCEGCHEFDLCGLPRARSVRSVLARNHHG
jgi:hypothetical protein